MLLLDVIIRYPTIMLLLWFAVMAFRDGRNLNTARYAAMLCISVAALLLGTPHPDLVLPWVPHVVVRMLDVPSVALVWWFGLSLFQDDFKLGVVEWIGMLLTIVSVSFFRFVELGLVQANIHYLIYFVATVSVLMMAHLIFVTINGRHDDVIESRRRVRFYFLIGLVVATLFTVIGERIFYDDYPVELSIFRAAIALPLVIWGLLWLTRFHPENLSFQAAGEVITVKTKIDPRDQMLHSALVDEMQSKQSFTEPGLTIRTLAENLDAPEHRLRLLINKGLGYRNFSSFLNKYRIDAVKNAMRMPENSRVQVLTLAMQVGFNSLAPFNRAFLSITGQTPSEFRAEIYQNTDQ